MAKIELFPELIEKFKRLKDLDISENRKNILQPLINYIQLQKDAGQPARLNFICTHNSRRSQLGQVWAQAISGMYGIDTQCFSGGTEETAFYINSIQALERAGFKVNSREGQNPKVEIYYSEFEEPLICFSKVYDAPENPSENFAALMTCSHADENCPFIAGSDIRIPLDYKDPKEFDGTHIAAHKYDERSDQIASEMIYVFQNIN